MNAIHNSYVEDNFDQILEALKNCQWEESIQDVSNQCYTEISPALHQAATKADRDERKEHARVLRLPGEATSMMMRPDKPDEPFNPVWVGAGRRPTSADDFTEAEIRLFHKIVNSIESPLLRGRLADLVWVRDKSLGIDNALTAIDSYRKVPLDTNTWFKDGEQCWNRAINLARMIRSASGDRLEQIEKDLIEALMAATTDDSFFSFRVAQMLRTNGLAKTDAKKVADRLETLAGEFAKSGDFHGSESFYKTAAEWYELSGDSAKAIDMTVAQAEAYVNEATARLTSDSPSHGVAASFVENAIQIYRSVPREERRRHSVAQRIQELRNLHTQYQQRAQEEMVGTTGIELDLTATVENARNSVSGKPPQEALIAFANLYKVNVNQLRSSAINSLSRSPFLASIPKVYSSSDGRIIGKTPGTVNSAPSDDDEPEILAQMNRIEYRTTVGVVVQGLILPALDVLSLEHQLRETDLIELCRRSPIVPPRREVLFGKALAAGFNREFGTSIHLLVPQIEHMVRFHLKSHGISTSNFDQNGLETENSLNTLVDLPQFSATFGEDWAYEIKTLFCEKIGTNLRNDTVHGLLDDLQIQSIDAIYAWWFLLKLVANTFWVSLRTSSDNENHQNPSEDKEL